MELSTWTGSRKALADLPILLAFVFGSVARDEITTSSDIDLMIIGDASLRRISSALAGVPEHLAATGLQHYRTIQAMALILGESFKEDVAFLDACRKKRNIVEYDAAGMASKSGEG